jgi:2,4-dichlorophenol 6-monooxygenase
MPDGSGPVPASREVPVLVVGGGPTGLTTALWLDQQGIPATLIERRDFAQHFPRAHLLNVRTMEIFHDLGVAEEIYASAAPDEGWHRVAWYTSLAGPTPLHGLKVGDLPAWGGGDDAVRYAEASPRRFANLPQLHLDRLLAEHAQARFGDRIHPGQELVALDIVADGVVATVLDRSSGETYQIRAEYVVAADGGRTSTGLLGIPMVGPRSLIDVVSLYFKADLSAYADETALLTYFVNPDVRTTVPGALLALSPAPLAKDSPEWTISMKFRLDDPSRQDLDGAVAAARELLGLPDLELEVKAMGHWQYEGVVAERFRVGPVFLAGDAAHRHPPTGGLGLNSGVQDAANLAWKLAGVLNGTASRSLLDTYEQERRPVTAFNVEHALRNAGRHAPIGEAMGLSPDLPTDQGWREVEIWHADDTAEGERRRAAVRAAVAHNAEDYGQLNVEAGFFYRSGAVIADGTPPPPDQDSPTAYTATARPGHHLPHLSLERDGERVSTIDLISLGDLTVFAGSDTAAAWRAAAEVVSRRQGRRLNLVALCEKETAGASAFLRLAGIEAGGALLVRPDKHVAWRTADLPADPAKALGAAVATVLSGTAHFAAGDLRDEIGVISDVGEILRSGSGSRGPRTFDSEPVDDDSATTAH